MDGKMKMSDRDYRTAYSVYSYHVFEWNSAKEW